MPRATRGRTCSASIKVQDHERVLRLFHYRRTGGRARLPADHLRPAGGRSPGANGPPGRPPKCRRSKGTLIRSGSSNATSPGSRLPGDGRGGQHAVPRGRLRDRLRPAAGQAGRVPFPAGPPRYQDADRQLTRPISGLPTALQARRSSRCSGLLPICEVSHELSVTFRPNRPIRQSDNILVETGIGHLQHAHHCLLLWRMPPQDRSILRGAL